MLITRLLMVNGPLKVKELWRSYEKILKENEKNGEPEKLDYFTSLTNLKKTVKLMRVKGKLVSNGYSRK